MKTQPSTLRTAEKVQTIKGAYLYRILSNAVNYYYTSYDRDVIVTGGPGGKMSNPQTFKSAIITHERPEQSTDLNPKEISFTLAAIDPLLRKYFLSVPAKEIQIELWRGNSMNLPSLAYADDMYMEFKGIAQSVSFSDYSVSASCSNLLMQQDREIPTFFYQSPCNHPLYSQEPGRCGINRALYTTTVTIAALSKKNRSVDVSLTSVTVDSPPRGITITAETFEGGILRDTNGNEIGIIACQVLPAAAGTRLWLQWMPPGMQAGDSIDISTGCRKIVRVCHDLYQNQANFGGTPYVPKQGNPAIDGIAV